jgi:hypothetical protein
MEPARENARCDGPVRPGRFRSADGVVEYTGKYVLVWSKLAGERTVVHYGVSSNQPEAGR